MIDPFTAALIAGGVSAGVGMLGPKKQAPGYSKGDLDFLMAQRQGQINEFSNALSAARGRYLAQLPQFQQRAMSTFAPNLEAKYGARGLQVGGGAFGSALGKKAADFQAEQMLSAIGMEREDLGRVDAARGNAYSGILGQSPAGNNPPDYGAPLGMLSSGLLSYGLSGMGQPSKTPAPWSGQGGIYGRPKGDLGLGSPNMYGNTSLSYRPNPFYSSPRKF